ncbi:DNA polymerase delta subunit 3 isoform X1 [Empidonax traillii]|uniref:DNA polymerase delta subunit 3 isoform X1 n=1 Tax=Empidonax traillii TaxID=164674 RepID=UPI000FFD4108|nr:DNA polymerase delta subunit 3 isoform X1 [Empidonax traillii]
MADELYLENIDEFVTDQNRVVTYKWLSYTLGVHVNQAKQMLYDYVERKRKENSGAQLHVTYLVAGDLRQNGHVCHKVAVVREDKLEAMKSKLSTIASVHVYSIQKALLKDSSPLYNTDYDIVKTNLHNCSKFSAIHCDAAVRRMLPDIPRAQTSLQGSSQRENDTDAPSAPAVNGHVPPAAKQPSQQHKGIMGMFAAKAASKPQDANKETKAEAPGVSTASSKPPTKNNIINNFFGKAAMNKLKVSPLPEQPKEEKEVVKPSVGVAEQESSPNPVVEKPGKRTESARIQQKDRKSKMKRVDRSDNEEERDPENTKRKRKRIKQLESDSSDEEGVLPVTWTCEKEVPKSLVKDMMPSRIIELVITSLFADVPPPPTPEEEKAPSPPHIPALKTELEPAALEVSAGGRKRKRVLKSKMFIDEEEGCMVTEKVYESESCTDSEEEFPKPKPPAAPKQPVLPLKKEPKEERKTLKKGAAPANRANKQVSIMGFFQKK